MSQALTASRPEEHASASRAAGAGPGAETHPEHRIFASTSDLAGLFHTPEGM